MTPDPLTDLSARVAAGDARAIARAISLVEDDGAPGRELISRIYPRTGRAFLVGVTGAPGTGKSTLVDRLIAELRRTGVKVGVLAVDPTSPFTGGARARRSCPDERARRRFRRLHPKHGHSWPSRWARPRDI